MNIYAWRVSEMLEGRRYEQLCTLVTKERLERSGRFLREIDTCRSLMGEAMIRLVAAADLNLSLSSIRFQLGEYGKPEISGSNSYRFNLSHSGDWVVLFTTKDGSRIGIDVEQIGDMLWQVAESVLTDRELSDLRGHAAEQQPAYFYRLWTMKESYIKALGTGLSMPLKQFSILRTADGFAGRGAGAENFSFQAYELDDSHKLSACSEGALPSCWQLFDLQQFLTMNQLQHGGRA
ncbi:hypothetical protein DUZ99_11065 [Xylanibacillus composti]|uniref:4'-phosphopantetheinyl transferase n=1 Tax=Xylanibacillus composti TaxID=1572762 RepID=A0A8J4GYR0_9BACL|nr:4'-phosphopantetheinyl transferase superfamily protein [Xylanibacillus composti]MDT9725510.1 hypothetical protein [Xylanibacillus composti]GIQ67604.1 4'-phosphopantetheinyl transferase [Xylanibacillus composti]